MGTPNSWLQAGQGRKPRRTSWLAAGEGPPLEPKPVDLTDIAAQQQRPIEELQRTFRAAREPVEQAQGVSIPVGAEIKLAPAPGLLEKVGKMFRRDQTVYAQAPRPTAEPLVRFTELMPGQPTATVNLPRYPGRFGPAVVPGERQPSAHETVEFPIGGVAKGTLEVAEGLTTPENVALIATLGLTAGALPLLSRIISAGFSVELLRGAIQQYPELREAMNTGDEQRVAKSLPGWAWVDCWVSLLALTPFAVGQQQGAQLSQK